MGTREGAISRALDGLDSNSFRDRLADLVAIPSTSQDPSHAPDVQRYLGDAIQPWLETLGFTVAIHPNPIASFGPILIAERIEDTSLPTVLTYGHGDTVRGLDSQWRQGLNPWVLTEEGDHWYGRGAADNKGQHDRGPQSAKPRTAGRPVPHTRRRPIPPCARGLHTMRWRN